MDSGLESFKKRIFSWVKCFFFFFEEKILRNREFREVILDDFGGIGIRWYRVLRLESTRIRNCDL